MKFTKRACRRLTGECIKISPPMRSANTPGWSHCRNSSEVRSRFDFGGLSGGDVAIILKTLAVRPSIDKSAYALSEGGRDEPKQVGRVTPCAPFVPWNWP